MKIPIFPGKYHQNGEFSMAMLVYRRVGDLVSGDLKETTPPKRSPRMILVHLASAKANFWANWTLSKSWLELTSWRWGHPFLKGMSKISNEVAISIITGHSSVWHKSTLSNPKISIHCMYTTSKRKSSRHHSLPYIYTLVFFHFPP